MVGPFQNDFVFSKEDKQYIYKWINNTIASEEWLSGCDLHLDEISSKYEQKESWLKGALELAKVGNDYLNDFHKGNSLVAVVFIPLYVEDIAKGYSFSSYWDIDRDLDITPPSLFICPYTWKEFNESFKKRKIVDYINSTGQRFNLYYFEELHDNELEYVRNVSLVPNIRI